jgi:hypothetical protein
MFSQSEKYINHDRIKRLKMEKIRPNKLGIGDGTQFSELQKNILVEIKDTKTIFDNVISDREEIFDLVQKGEILEEMKKGRLTTRK